MFVAKYELKKKKLILIGLYSFVFIQYECSFLGLILKLQELLPTI